MRLIAFMLAGLLLAGCGADTMSAAATSATLKQQEVKQGKKTLDNARSRIDAAAAQMQRSADRTADTVENN